MVSDSAAFWIKEYKLDGFRHDAAKHVPENTGACLHETHPGSSHPRGACGLPDRGNFWEPRTVRRYINPGCWMHQFEFSLYWDARAAFTMDNVSFRDLGYSLQQSFSYFGDHNLMGNVTGNPGYAAFYLLCKRFAQL